MPDMTLQDRIAESQLDHDPANSLGPDIVTELNQQLDSAFEQADGVIICGRPGLFSAGLNLHALLQLDRAQLTDFWRDFFSLLGKLAAAPIPVVAALTGHSPAGGAVCAIFCDYRVMTQGDYKVGLNEVQVGLVAPAVIQNALRRLVGPRQAERLLVAGALLSPDQALAVGMVDELAESPEATVAAARNWLQQHLALPRTAMLATRKLARQSVAAPFENLDNLGIQTFVEHWFLEETQATLQQVMQQLAARKKK